MYLTQTGGDKPDGAGDPGLLSLEPGFSVLDLETLWTGTQEAHI